MLSCTQEFNDGFGFGLLNLFVLDFPVVVFVEKPEDSCKVLGLLLEEMVENVEFCPLNLLVVVQVVGLQEFFFDLAFLEVLEVLGVGGSLDVSNAFLHHFHNYMESSLLILGFKNSDSSLRSALLPYSLNSLASFLPSYCGQALNSFISLSVSIPSSSLSMILRKDLVKFSSPLCYILYVYLQ